VALIRTNVLEIAFEQGGAPDGIPILLLHGWPDAPCGWNALAQHLQTAGYRTIVPYLRGSNPTQFLSPETPRVGSGVRIEHLRGITFVFGSGWNPPLRFLCARPRTIALKYFIYEESRDGESASAIRQSRCQFENAQVLRPDVCDFTLWRSAAILILLPRSTLTRVRDHPLLLIVSRASTCAFSLSQATPAPVVPKTIGARTWGD
jgi:hypothetical protein